MILPRKPQPVSRNHRIRPGGRRAVRWDDWLARTGRGDPISVGPNGVPDPGLEFAGRNAAVMASR